MGKGPFGYRQALGVHPYTREKESALSFINSPEPIPPLLCLHSVFRGIGQHAKNAERVDAIPAGTCRAAGHAHQDQT